jgi:hypothetical protein
MDPERIEDCLERLCAKGCRAVAADIAALEGGTPLPEVRELSPTEVSMVIAELKAIMAVYEGHCDGGQPVSRASALAAGRTATQVDR